MAQTYTRRFRVRSTDCDAAGQVNHAVYARYLQEAAIEASAGCGYDTAWYDRHGVNWVIRRSVIDYLRPARYGDEIDVTTYVANFRRVRSQRNYEIVRVGDGERLVEAATDWVFVDQGNGAPARIPAEMSRAFLPNGPIAEDRRILDADRLPDTSPASAFLGGRRVNYYDMDENAHVNNAVYLNYLEQATLDATARLGFDMPQCLELGGLFVVRRHDVEYLRPARYGDTLDIATWVSEASGSGMVRYTLMRLPGGDLAARARTRWVWIDLARREPAPVPDPLLAALRTQTERET